MMILLLLSSSSSDRVDVVVVAVVDIDVPYELFLNRVQSYDDDDPNHYYLYCLVSYYSASLCYSKIVVAAMVMESKKGMTTN